MDFAVPADHSVKIKESEKTDKYLNLVRALKKLGNIKVTVILIVVGAFETVPKVLEKRFGELEIRGRVGTIQTTTLLRSARILRRSWRPEEIYCHADFMEKFELKLV